MWNHINHAVCLRILFLCFGRADILRENAEALFAACDAAHGRWAKIVGIRSQIHPKLKLQEFLGVYNISQEFISSTEKVSSSYSLLQSVRELFNHDYDVISCLH